MSVLAWAGGACTLLAAVITINVFGNLRAFRRLSTFAAVPAPETPFVSILLPARNEERAIGTCLDSLITQEYPAYEVLVLDDGSTDETAAIVRAACARSPRVRLITGLPLPDGWYGKAFACHQLAAQARGDVLIFTDADTTHASTLMRAVVGAIGAGADVVTTFPEQVAGGWVECLATGFMLFVVWAFLPVGRVWSDPSPRFVAANGQLLAFTAAAYRIVGGHGAVRRSILDDVDLARRAKEHHLRVRLTDGVGTVRARMYRGAGEVVRGFSKNALALTGGTLAGAFACAALLSALYLLSPIFLVTAVASGRGGGFAVGCALALVLLMVIQAGVITRRTRGSAWQVILHPLAVLIFLVILGNSIRWRLRGYREWKGRAYPAGSEPKGSE